MDLMAFSRAVQTDILLIDTSVSVTDPPVDELFSSLFVDVPDVVLSSELPVELVTVFLDDVSPGNAAILNVLVANL